VEPISNFNGLVLDRIPILATLDKQIEAEHDRGVKMVKEVIQ
jgi:hypothetical protein